jgi:pimeloyl-ACP methyl ester carboxylesterase
MKIKEDILKIDGISTRYLTSGQGAPLVFLHGIGESSFDWRWLMPDLLGERCIYALDMPYSSGINQPREEYSQEFLAEFVFRFLSELNIDKPVVVGHSLGGIVAITMALKDPELLKDLVLVCSAGLGTELNPLLSMQTLPGYSDFLSLISRTPMGALHRVWARSLVLYTYPYLVPPEWTHEQYRLTLTPHFMDALLGALRNHVNIKGQQTILIDHLSKIKMPTLIIWGGNDRVIPLSHAKEAMKHLPNARLEVISDCGHMPHVERPSATAAVLNQFLIENIGI